MKLLDFRIDREDGREVYRFRFGYGQDFEASLWLLKKAVPFDDRDWNPETKEWSVLAGAYDWDLATIFDNFAQCRDLARSQVRLPGL